MPLYDMRCPSCKKTCKKLTAKLPKIICAPCNVAMVRDFNAPGCQVNEVLDNGHMPRKIERLRDAEALYRDRSKRDKS
jgi:hypothetical protein